MCCIKGEIQNIYIQIRILLMTNVFNETTGLWFLQQRFTFLAVILSLLKMEVKVNNEK